MDEEEAVDYGEIRRKIHSAISEIMGEEEVEESLIFGWAIIIEGIHQNNKRSLTWVTSDATGDRALTPWASRGYMDHVENTILNVYHDGSDEEDEE